MKLARLQTVEVERYTEDDYDRMLDEEGDVDICGFTYQPSYVLKEIDPTAYHCGFNDFQEYDDKYQCPECGEYYDEEYDAMVCCRLVYQCPECGNWYDDEIEAENCCDIEEDGEDEDE